MQKKKNLLFLSHLLVELQSTLFKRIASTINPNKIEFFFPFFPLVPHFLIIIKMKHQSLSSRDREMFLQQLISQRRQQREISANEPITETGVPITEPAETTETTFDE